MLQLSLCSPLEYGWYQVAVKSEMGLQLYKKKIDNFISIKGIFGNEYPLIEWNHGVGSLAKSLLGFSPFYTFRSITVSINAIIHPDVRFDIRLTY